MSASDLTAPAEHRTVSWLPGYRFGNDGSGESCRGNGHGEYNSFWRKLNPSRRNNGHYRFDVSVNGVRRSVTMHEMICEAWNGSRPTGTECIWIDGNRDNLRPSNLTWGILPENSMDPSIEYREILPECDGYRFGYDGSVWTCWRTNTEEKTDVWRKLSPYVSVSGHLQLSIKFNGKTRVVDANHMICLAFYGPPPEGMVSCHFPDRDPTNNRASNLRWDTPLENVRDQMRHGTKAHGEQHGSAVLNDEKVQLIRR